MILIVYLIKNFGNIMNSRATIRATNLAGSGYNYKIKNRNATRQGTYKLSKQVLHY